MSTILELGSQENVANSLLFCLSKLALGRLGLIVNLTLRHIVRDKLLASMWTIQRYIILVYDG